MAGGGRGQGQASVARRAAAPDADAAGAHPTTGLNDTVHQRHRLGILAITSKARQADFGYLRETLGLTSGNLSTHLTVLEDAGLVRVEKGYEGRRPRTWVSITRSGRAALAAEMESLARLVREHGPAQGSEMSGGGNERNR
jgi:predicted ArsR family transcriptional regulator